MCPHEHIYRYEFLMYHLISAAFVNSICFVLVGQCPFLPLISHNNNESYVLSSVGNVTLLKQCTGSQEQFIHCDRNSNWESDVENICSSRVPESMYVVISECKWK